MAIVLRLDIDKPYGRSSLPKKVLSKLREDYVFPKIDSLGYLDDLASFLELLNAENIPAISYHRLCTAPNARVSRLLEAGGHQFGLHAEDTRSLETLQREAADLEEMSGFKVTSFSKHGNGDLKLGRNHYAPYEPEKYKAWSKELRLPFPFGNGLAGSESDFLGHKGFYPNMFWLEPDYQKPEFNSLTKALDVAESSHLIVIIHPENLAAIPQVRTSFLELVKEAKARKIPFQADLRKIFQA